MIKNMIDYSKAVYHLENLKISVKRAESEINSEDISIKFLYDCMNEKIEDMKDMRERYESFVSSFFSNTDNMYKIETENKTFLIFKQKIDMIKYMNKYNDKSFTLIENIAVFYTDRRKVIVPEKEERILNKQYLFLGRFNVLIGL
jgi:hypothetical protein